MGMCLQLGADIWEPAADHDGVTLKHASSFGNPQGVPNDVPNGAIDNRHKFGLPCKRRWGRPFANTPWNICKDLAQPVMHFTRQHRLLNCFQINSEAIRGIVCEGASWHDAVVVKNVWQ